jgi:PKD repeat protein
MKKRFLFLLLLLLSALLLSACNLGAAEQATMTPTSTRTPTATGSITPTITLPTALPSPGVVILPTSIIRTSVVILPTPIPTQIVTTPIRIAIFSPGPGSIVSGNVTVFGSAVHPQFLQYQLEYGPAVNPQNLWYPISGVISTPLLDGVLGTWATGAINDGEYQLRLRLFLRDGTTLSTVTGGIQVRNSRPTPVPTQTPAVARPLAAFTQSVTQGETPLTVRFTSLSSGQITNYNWNFGDNTTSTEQNPVKTYNRAGLFTVSLTVTGPGGSSNVSSQILVTSPSAPRAAFTASPLTGNAPLTVQFTNQSTGQITSYFWNFGDGSTSTSPSPQKVFQNVGTYNVFLTVSGPGGVAIATGQIVVTSPQVPAPQAAFTSNPVQGVAPLNVQFLNRSTGQITSYSWNFGDGNISDQEDPQHTYIVPGTYTVTLIVTGPGGSSTVQSPIVVTAPTPTITNTPSATATNTSIPVSTETPTLTATPTLTTTASATPTATPTNTQEVVVLPTETFTQEPPTATPETPTLTPTLIPPTETATLTVTPIPPTETFTQVPPTETATLEPVGAGFSFAADPNNSLAVQFISSVTGPVASYAWDFGDGTGSQEANPLKQYAAGGSYTVTLTVTGTGGQTNSTQQIVPVASPTDIPPTETATLEPVSAGFTFAADPNNSLAVQFTSSVTGPVASYAWDFGDGTGSQEANPLKQYAAGGSYTVTLTVTGAGGQTNSTQQIVPVASPTPIPPTETPTLEPVSAGFTFAADPNNSLAVQFTSSVTGPVASYAWDFGDGTGSQEANPLKQYAMGMDYTVTLTVTGAGGQTNSTQQIVSVANPTPAATPTATSAPLVVEIGASPSQMDPATINFTSTVNDPGATFAWDFGDGMGSSSEANPTYTYANSGTFTVTLTVTGSDQISTASDTTTVEIAPQQPTDVPPQSPSFTLTDAGSASALAFSPTGGRVVAAYGGANVARVWDVGSQSVVATLSGHSGAVNAVAWNPSTSQPVSAGSDGNVIVWDASAFTPAATLATGGTLTHVDVNALGTLIAAGDSSGLVTLWDVASQSILTQLQANGAIAGLSFRGNGQQLAYASASGTIYIYDLANSTAFFEFNAGGAVNDITYSPDGERIAVAFDDGSVTLFDTLMWSPSAILSGHSGAVTAVSYNGGGTLLATAGEDGTVILFNTSSGEALPNNYSIGAGVNDVDWSADSAFFGTASEANTVLVWQP